jgi:hypothetical protein
MDAFTSYKQARPRAGAILLDPTGHVLLVRGCGEEPRWGFPKGGVEPPEQPGGVQLVPPRLCC